MNKEQLIQQIEIAFNHLDIDVSHLWNTAIDEDLDLETVTEFINHLTNSVAFLLFNIIDTNNVSLDTTYDAYDAQLRSKLAYMIKTKLIEKGEQK